MKNNLKSTILSVIIMMIGLSACSAPPNVKKLWDNKYKPINTLPMYGAPEIKKTEAQKNLDEEFIAAVTKESGSREKSSIEFSTWGWREKQKENLTTAMKRFNQAWLLDPNSYLPYWGFGAVELAKKNPKEAAKYFEMALSFIDDEKEKPRLQVDTARAYAWMASESKESNSAKSKELYKKSNSLIDDALAINPKYKKAYSLGGFTAYEQGDYKRAWSIVKESHKSGYYKFNPEFITKLSKEMPEP